MNPQDLGCKCDECPLQGREPCIPPAVVSPRPKLAALVLDYPGEQETKQHRFLVGPTGQDVRERILDPLGVKKSFFHVTTAVLCHPGRKMTPAERKATVAACRPRLARELQRVEGLGGAILAGPQATLAVTGAGKLGDVVGSPTMGADFFIGGRIRGTCVADFTWLRVLPTFQPSLLYKDKWHYLPVFRRHVQRGLQMALGRLPEWDWGRIVIEPGQEMLEALREIARTPEDPISVDIETTGIEFYDVDITCIGVANSEVSVSVPWIDWKGGTGVRDGQTDAEKLIRYTLLWLLTGPHTKILQNGIFDRMVLQAHNIKIQGPYFDTLHAHMLFAPGLPHNLSFQMATEFHSPRWKVEYRGKGKTGGMEK